MCNESYNNLSHCAVPVTSASQGCSGIFGESGLIIIKHCVCICVVYVSYILILLLKGVKSFTSHSCYILSEQSRFFNFGQFNINKAWVFLGGGLIFFSFCRRIMKPHNVISLFNLCISKHLKR